MFIKPLLKSLLMWEWSLLLPGTGVEGIFSGYQKLVIFYRAIKTFARFLPGHQNFLPQFFQSMRHENLHLWYTKTDKKSKIIDKMRNYYDAYFIPIYYELITILFTYCTHTHTHTHTHVHTHAFGINSNNLELLIKGIPNTTSR